AALTRAVTRGGRLLCTITTGDAVAYTAAQVVGGCVGAVIANVMFELPAFEASTQVRSSRALWFSEVVATIGLLPRRRGFGRRRWPVVTAQARQRRLGDH